MNKIKRNARNAYTLIELIISVTLISFISGISIPVYLNFEFNNEIEVTKNEIVLSLRNAQTFAKFQNSDSSWGVEIQTGKITLFQGIVFASRDATYDNVYAVPSRIVFIGLSEVIFTKFTGIPSQNGSITLKNANTTRIISINSQGTIND